MIFDISATALDLLANELPADAPIHMLNLLRFRVEGGREAYFQNYLPAFQAIVAEQGIMGISPIWLGSVAGHVAAPTTESWDAVAIIRYPSLGAFRSLVESEAYRERAGPHRLAALADWRLIAQTELVLA